MKKLITILFLLVQMVYGQFSGDYNIGTGETYTTLKSFCDAVNAGTVTGNITAYITTDLTEAANVGLGVNTNGFSITLKPSADADRTITFTQLADNTSPTGHFVIGYLGTGLSSAWSDANTIATNNVTIDGYATGGSTRRLTFTNTSASHTNARVIVVVGACENTIIKNCSIINLTTSTGSPFCVGGVVRKGTVIEVAPIGLTIENNILTATGNVVAMGSRITNSGTITTSRLTGLVFRNNIVTARRRLLEINYTTGGEINNNEFYTIQTGVPGTISYGLWTSTGVTGTINIYNNKFLQSTTQETGAFGHRVVSLSSGATYNIYNNFFTGMDKTAASTVGLNLVYLFYSGVAGTIYNNTFYMPALTNATSTGYYAAIQLSGNTATIKNNIFISDEATHTNPYFISAVPTPVPDYNNYYMRQSNVNHKVVAAYTTLSAYQIANPTKDINSISKNVSFTSSTDLHLGQSVGDYDIAGTPIDGYTTDIDGQTRSTTFPYMGADENTNVVLAASYKRPVDGVAADWTGTPSGTLHATVVSTEEAIYTGESGDSRTDQHGGAAEEDANNDITEFRFTRDQSYIYFMVKFRDITTLDRPYIAIGIDANQSDDTPVWIGDDTEYPPGVRLVPATNRAWERQLAVHATTSGILDIEMFADDGSEWYAPLSNYQVSGSTDNNVIEFRVALHDLAITSSTTLNLAIATFNNQVGFNNVVDATTGSFIDVVTPGYSGSNNAWFRAGESNTDLNANVSWNQSLSPLPVELTSLNANVFGKDVKLGWSTATEVNSYQFVVEKNSNEVWNTIGTVNATGNSNSPKEYSFTDNNLQPGKYLYRLKMVDNDGSYEYSQTVEVDIDVPKEYVLMQNYPNPFNPVTNINYTISVDSKVMLVIYSISGEKVAELVNETQGAGSYSIPFNASHLASGTYVYRLIANDFVQTKKMLLIK